MKKNRSSKKVQSKLEVITETCKGNSNLMVPVIEAAKEGATLGEIVTAMKTVFGEWEESSTF